MKVLVIICFIFAFSPLSAKDKVFVTIGPLQFLVQKICNNTCEVEALIPAGKNPHTFYPTPKILKQVASGKLFFSVNAPFEQILLKRIKAQNSITLINLARNLKMRSFHTTEDHDHHDSHHHHSNYDPHVWLSTVNIKIMLADVSSALSKIYPDKKTYFQQQLSSSLKQVESIHKQNYTQLSSLKNKEVLVFHPSFGYFLDEYGLKQITIESEGKKPTPKQIAKVIDYAQKRNIQIIFTQPQFSQKAAQTIARAINGKVESLNHLEYDLFTNLQTIAKAIATGHKQMRLHE